MDRNSGWEKYSTKTLNEAAIQVRPMTIDDTDLVFSLFSKSFNRMNQQRAKLLEVAPPATPSTMWELYMRWGPCIVAMAGSRVAGILLSNARDPHVLDIVNLYVEEDSRGRGVATSMLVAFEDLALRNEYYTVMTLVSTLWDTAEPSLSGFLVRRGFESMSLDDRDQLFLLKSDLHREEQVDDRRIRIVLG